MAQCAAVFGGGTAGYGDYRLIELLRYTDKAVKIVKAVREDE